MRSDIVLSLTGPDRIGIVEEVTGVLNGLRANVGTSRMARLGGEFSIIMLVTAPADVASDLSSAFDGLRGEGYTVALRETSSAATSSATAASLYRVDVRGADHEGIVHEISAGLARRGINIEAAETAITEAPVSGTPLFSMSALIAVPEKLDESDWMSELADAGARANVDVTVSPATQND